MPESADFAELCRRLPPGHWHCKHGHLRDCPDEACPRVPDVPLAHVIMSHRVAWIFPDEAVARAQERLLADAGATPVCLWRLTPDRVRTLVRRLPANVEVEDLRW